MAGPIRRIRRSWRSSVQQRTPVSLLRPQTGTGHPGSGCDGRRRYGQRAGMRDHRCIHDPVRTACESRQADDGSWLSVGAGVYPAISRSATSTFRPIIRSPNGRKASTHGLMMKLHLRPLKKAMRMSMIIIQSRYLRNYQKSVTSNSWRDIRPAFRAMDCWYEQAGIYQRANTVEHG